MPPYYKIKAYLALSGANEEDGPEENIAACRHFLNKAEEALREAQQIYVNEERAVDVLKSFQRIIQEERQNLRKREQSDSDSD